MSQFLAPTFFSPDRDDMYGKLLAAPERAREHLAKGLQLPFKCQPGRPIRQILVCGMGGSGSTGDLLQALANQSSLPIWVNKSAQLPAWVNAETLVIGVSYSGETAETLTCVQSAFEKGAQLHLLASGGALQAFALAQNLSFVLLAGGLPPRAALFDMLFALLGSLAEVTELALNPTELEKALLFLAEICLNWVLAGPTPPLPYDLALKLKQGQTQPLFWGNDPATACLTMRWKNQFSENAKTFASCSVLPELNHNEMVAMCAAYHSQIHLIHLTLGSVDALAERVSLEMVGPQLAGVHTIRAEGQNHLERVLYLACLGDFVSVYLALLKEIDPTPIAAINEFKRRITQTPS
ncbi:MAG: SIS domain-containing protein [Candidatus Sericytochromatia bacterium]